MLNTLGQLATMEAKRATVQRKRKACAELREFMVGVNVPEPQDPPCSERKRETFSDLANQARPIPWVETEFKSIEPSLFPRKPLKVRGLCSPGPEQRQQLDSIVAEYEGNLPEVGLVGMHDLEKGFSLCCLQVPAFPCLGHDTQVWIFHRMAADPRVLGTVEHNTRNVHAC